jgi:broad specificity phosphatase PhoE
LRFDSGWLIQIVSCLHRVSPRASFSGTMKFYRSPKSSFVCWFGVFLVMMSLSATAFGLDVYILRHGETMGNVTGDYSEQNQRTFSPNGLKQVEDVPNRLQGLPIHHILVSPLWRTQHTILPYLKATGMQAEIFPAIEECDCGINGREPDVGLTLRKQAAEIIEEGTNYFFFSGDLATARYAPTHPAEGAAILREAVDQILSRFGGTTQSVLLVTHSCTGGRLMELLLGLPPQGMLAPANAVVSHVRQRPDGGFDLLAYNGEPLTTFRKMLLFGFKSEDLPGFINLAGEWRITAGDDSGYAALSFDDNSWKSTRVPGGWEKDALPDYDGLAWYRLQFDVPSDVFAAWGTNTLALIMGAVDDADETYLNNHAIGAMGRFSPEKKTAWDQPRIYEFDASLLQETNVLAVRVDDWGGGGGIWRGPVAIGPASVLRSQTTP